MSTIANNCCQLTSETNRSPQNKRPGGVKSLLINCLSAPLFAAPTGRVFDLPREAVRTPQRSPHSAIRLKNFFRPVSSRKMGPYLDLDSSRGAKDPARLFVVDVPGHFQTTRQSI